MTKVGISRIYYITPQSGENAKEMPPRHVGRVKQIFSFALLSLAATISQEASGNHSHF
jgi:hypothetical protein